MLRHACLALFAGFDRLALLATKFDFSLQDAGACAGGRVFFCAVIPSLQQQHELVVIELFAAFAEDAPDKQVDLFLEQLDLLRLPRVLFSESGFQRRHHDDLERSKSRTNFAPG